MPRERQAFFRETNTQEKEKIIVLAFEGNETEEIYFEALKLDARYNDDLIYLHLLSRGKNDTNSAPKHVFNKLKTEAKDKYNFGKADELWMIIDKDRWPNIPTYIDLCKKQGNMFIGGSNPCFEFWLLLHVKDIATLTATEQVDLLHNKRVNSKKRYIDKYLSDLLADGYNKSNPRPERFLPHLKVAIQQAKKLDAQQEDFPSDLGSHIYRVVEKIIK